MRLQIVVGCVILLPACSADNGQPGGSPDAAGPDATAPADGGAEAGDGTKPDGGGAVDASSDAVVSPDATSEAADGGGAGDGGPDGGDDGACPASWFAPPVVDAPIPVPADGGGVVLVHAAAAGTQNYACTAGADGGFAWGLVAPDAVLRDCHAVIGHHFASEGGPTAPEWMLDDGSYAIGQRVAQFVPEGGAASIPWVLLRVIGQSDAGILSQATFVQRLNTNGGIAPPASACGTDGGVQMVPYSADYYFYGP